VAAYVRHASASGAGGAGFAPGPAPGVGWTASVRMASVRTARCESGNGENLLGQHLSDGAIFLYVTGYEYVDAFPAWDWQRVPGTSVLPFAEASMAPGGQGTTRFVGGASDAWYGAAALDFRRVDAGAALTARKSWAFLEEGAVALGAAVAALCAVELGASSQSLGFPIAGVYTYGEPRVGNDQFAKFYMTGTQVSWRVTHWRDIVPHLPPEAFGFHHTATEVWYTEDQKNYTVCDGSGEDPTCADQLFEAVSIDDHLQSRLKGNTELTDQIRHNPVSQLAT
jgi:hypothetical protein